MRAKREAWLAAIIALAFVGGVAGAAVAVAPGAAGPAVSIGAPSASDLASAGTVHVSLPVSTVPSLGTSAGSGALPVGPAASGGEGLAPTPLPSEPSVNAHAVAPSSARGISASTAGAASAPAGPPAVGPIAGAAATLPAAPSQRAVPGSAQLSLSSTKGLVGSTLLLDGVGFTPGSPVTATFAGASAACAPATDVSSLGSFVCNITIPIVAAGTYSVAASTPADGLVVSPSSFVVTPELSLAGTSFGGTVGTPVTVEGTGYTAGQIVYFVLLGYTPVNCLVGYPIVAANGTFSCTFDVPAIAAGAYTATAYTMSDLIVSPSAWYTVYPSVTFSPSSGTVGSAVVLSGSGFTGGDVVTAEFGAVSEGCSPGVTVAGNGSFSCTLIVPTSAGGSYSIGATTQDEGTTAASPYTVLPSLTIAPGSGPDGAAVVALGNGFNFGYGATTVSFAGEGAYMGSISCSVLVLPNGTFGCPFTVPTPTPGGAYTFSASGSDSPLDTASASFLVVPGLALSVSTGPVGTSVTIVGDGFTGSAVLSVDGTSFSPSACSVGSVVGPTVSTTAAGAFSCSTTIPTLVAGTYPFVGEDVATGTATAPADFLVVPTQSAPTASAPTSDIGEPITFSANVAGGSGSGLYAWSASSSLGCTPTTGPVLTCDPTGAGASSVAYAWTDANGIGAVGATARSYTIFADPALSLPSPSRGSVDLGQGVTFSASLLSSGSGGLTYGWSESDPTLALGCAMSVTGATAELVCLPKLAGTYTVSLSVTDSNGVTESSTSAVFTVFADPSVSAPVANTSSGTVGQSVGFTSTLLNAGSGGETYAWSESDLLDNLGCLLSVAGSSISLACLPVLEGSYTVTITVTDSNGGSGSATSSSFSVQLAILSLLQPSITVSPAQGPAGSTVTVSGSGFPALTATTLVFDGVPITACSSGSLTTTLLGTLSCTFAVPALASGDLVEVTASGADPAEAVFSVTTPSIALSASEGPAGSTVTLTGSGFSPSGAITLLVGGVAVSSCSSGSLTASAEGTVDCTFTIPSGTSGSSVTATNAGGASAGSTFTVTTPTLVLSASEGPAGAKVTLSGSGFAGSSALTLAFDGVAISACSAGSLGTSATGTFSCTVSVPSGSSGTTVKVSGGGASASATFTVTTPAVTVSPASGAVGASVTVSGTGFSVDATVALSFDGVTITTGTSGSLATSSSGAFGLTFLVPSGTSGSSVKVTDPGGASASGTFTVTVPPAIVVTPGQGPIGTSVTISGSDFAPSTTVSLLFGGVKVSSGGAPTISVGSSGSFSCTVTVPSGTTTASVSATDSNGQSASAPFTVTTPAITLSAPQGPAGTTVTVSGSGFSVSAGVTLSFDGSRITSCTSGSLTTSSAGTFSCSVTVPSSCGGSTVTATDETGRSASATFTVTVPVLSVSPGSGIAGSSATVSGSGFPVSSGVTLSFDGVPIAVCTEGGLATSASGAFGCSVSVPSGTSGSAVIASAQGSSASASFTVTLPPAITVSPGQGPVGTSVTVSGANFPAGSTVTIDFDGVKVSCGCGNQGTSVGSSGTFSCTFTVPSGTSGTEVTASDSGGGSASATFAVTTPAISLSSASGAAGSTVTISGTGFSTSSPLTLTFDGVSVRSCSSGSLTTSSSGTFSCTITVPSGTSGSTVTVSDGCGVSASGSFTVSGGVSRCQ